MQQGINWPNPACTSGQQELPLTPQLLLLLQLGQRGSEGPTTSSIGRSGWGRGDRFSWKPQASAQQLRDPRNAEGKEETWLFGQESSQPGPTLVHRAEL